MEKINGFLMQRMYVDIIGKILEFNRGSRSIATLIFYIFKKMVE